MNLYELLGVDPEAKTNAGLLRRCIVSITEDVRAGRDGLMYSIMDYGTTETGNSVVYCGFVITPMSGTVEFRRGRDANTDSIAKFVYGEGGYDLPDNTFVAHCRKILLANMKRIYYKVNAYGGCSVPTQSVFEEPAVCFLQGFRFRFSQGAIHITAVDPKKETAKEGETDTMVTSSFTNTLVDLNKEAAIKAAKIRAAKEALLLVKSVVAKCNLPPAVSGILESPFGDLLLMNAVASFAALNGNATAEKVAKIGLEVAYQELLTVFLPHLTELMQKMGEINAVIGEDKTV